jgi:hypothetical protein
MIESQLQYEILRIFGARPDLRLWRSSTGKGISMDGRRVLSFGVTGQADLSGIVAGSGRRLEVEIKSATGRQSPEQVAFQAMIQRFGGIYVVARSIEDVERALSHAKLR